MNTNWENIKTILNDNPHAKIMCSVKFNGMKHYYQGYFVKDYHNDILFHYIDSKKQNTCRHVTDTFNNNKLDILF